MEMEGNGLRMCTLGDYKGGSELLISMVIAYIYIAVSQLNITYTHCSSSLMDVQLKLDHSRYYESTESVLIPLTC